MARYNSSVFVVVVVCSKNPMPDTPTGVSRLYGRGRRVGEERNKEAKQAGVRDGAGPGGLQKEYEGDGQTDGGGKER